MNPPVINRRVAKHDSYSLPSNSLRPVASRTESKQVSYFASTLAHEVRNPLSNINLATDMLLSLVNNNEQKIYLDIIMRAATRITDLVTDLLTSAPPGEIQAGKHSVPQLINEVIAMTEDRIRLKNITIRKDYATKDRKIILDKK